jgi:hypothetical protein
LQDASLSKELVTRKKLTLTKTLATVEEKTSIKVNAMKLPSFVIVTLIIRILVGNNKSYLELDEVVASREAVQMVVKIEKEGENKSNESLSVDAIK